MKHMKFPVWVLCYKHDWDKDGRIYPEVHTFCYLSEEEAREDRDSMLDPSKYWLRKTYLQMDINETT